MATSLEQPPAAPVHETAPVEIDYGELRSWAAVRETWRQRHALPRIGIRMLVKGLSGTLLGPFWLIAAPLISLFGLSLILGRVLNPPSSGIPYLILVLGGAVGWTCVGRTAFWGTRSFDVYRRISNNVYIPPIMVPLASITITMIEVITSLAILAATTLVFFFIDGKMYIELGPKSILAPIGMLWGLALGWGVGLWTGTLNARTRDVRIVFRYVIIIWMYVTPVLYPLAAIPEHLKLLAAINPAAAPVEVVKEGMLGVGEVPLEGVLISLSLTTALVVSGIWFCSRMAPRFQRRRIAPMDDEEDGF